MAAPKGQVPWNAGTSQGWTDKAGEGRGERMIHYDPEERGHRRGRCARCGYAGWSDDCGNCPNCEPVEPHCEYCDGGEKCTCTRCDECNGYLDANGKCEYCLQEASK